MQRQRPTNLVALAVLSGLTTCALAVLRSTDRITWSWWWVLAPTWGLFAGMLLVLLALIVHAAVTKR